MIFARLVLGHTSAGSLLGREEQDRGAEVTAFTLASEWLDSPREGNHILCFEAIAIFLNLDFGREVVMNYLNW